MHRSFPALLLVLATCASACGSPGAVPDVPRSVGPGEGVLDLVASPGAVEDGANDPKLDWVHPFERRTGCQVTVRYANTAEEIVGLLRQRGSFDGALVSSDVAGRLIQHRDVAPLRPGLLPGMASFLPPLRRPAFATLRGRLYGVPFDYGPNLLLVNAAVARPTPTSGSVLWEPDSPYRGKTIGLASWMSLADAALYLRSHRPSLGITDPYELTSAQLEAAKALLLRQVDLSGKNWGQFGDEILAFAGGSVVVGVGRPIVADLSRSVPIRGVVPREGVTGWADLWVMAARPTHPNCMARWLRWTTSPGVQAQAAQWNASAPANPDACPALRRAVGPAALTIAYGRCGDERFLRSLWLWRTPSSDCGNGRDDCMDYRAWLQAWAEVGEA